MKIRMCCLLSLTYHIHSFLILEPHDAASGPLLSPVHLLTSAWPDSTLHSGPSDRNPMVRMAFLVAYFPKHLLLLHYSPLSYSIIPVITLSIFISRETAKMEPLTVVFSSVALIIEPRALDMVSKHTNTKRLLSPDSEALIEHHTSEFRAV